jgi:hypothetical protein
MASTVRSDRSRASRRRSALRASATSPRCARFQTLIPVSGSVTSRATSEMSRASAGAPSALRRPRPLPSVVMFATALRASSSPWVSAHSVEPSSIGSSPSHSASTMVRRGRQPCLSSAPYARASSSTAMAPEIGSSAPLTQAS